MYLYFHCFASEAQGLENGLPQTAVGSNGRGARTAW
jgi:hypothetical protein